MSNRTETFERIKAGGVIAVLRGVDPEPLRSIASALADGGITAIEVTANTAGVTDMIAMLSKHFAEEDVVVGAGTVLDAPTARAVQLAGAEFVVTPTLNTDVIEISNRYGTPVVPGTFTPSEALAAIEAGADAIKLFPASSLGAQHVGAMKGPLPQIEIIPTGGITANNAQEYIEAGATAVGAGGALVPEGAVEDEDWSAIETRAKEFVDAVERGRS